MRSPVVALGRQWPHGQAGDAGRAAGFLRDAAMTRSRSSPSASMRTPSAVFVTKPVDAEPGSEGMDIGPEPDALDDARYRDASPFSH